MRRTRLLLAVSALTFTTLANAQLSGVGSEPCPPSSRGPPPWVTNEIVSGDLYAYVYLDVDKRGRPSGCKIGTTNILGDDKFWVCQAYMRQWTTRPPANPGLDGRTTTERLFIEYGWKHASADRAARIAYFHAHPYLHPECYRQNGSTGERGPVLTYP